MMQSPVTALTLEDLASSIDNCATRSFVIKQAYKFEVLAILRYLDATTRNTLLNEADLKKRYRQDPDFLMCVMPYLNAQGKVDSVCDYLQSCSLKEAVAFLGTHFYSRDNLRYMKNETVGKLITSTQFFRVMNARYTHPSKQVTISEVSEGLKYFLHDYALLPLNLRPKLWLSGAVQRLFEQALSLYPFMPSYRLKLFKELSRQGDDVLAHYRRMHGTMCWALKWESKLYKPQTLAVSRMRSGSHTCRGRFFNPSTKMPDEGRRHHTIVHGPRFQ